MAYSPTTAADTARTVAALGRDAYSYKRVGLVLLGIGCWGENMYVADEPVLSDLCIRAHRISS